MMPRLLLALALTLGFAWDFQGRLRLGLDHPGMETPDLPVLTRATPDRPPPGKVEPGALFGVPADAASAADAGKGAVAGDGAADPSSDPLREWLSAGGRVRLLGVILTQDRNDAVLSIHDDKGDASRAVKRGEELFGYRLETVEMTQVRFVGPEGERILKIFTPGATNAAELTAPGETPAGDKKSRKPKNKPKDKPKGK